MASRSSLSKRRIAWISTGCWYARHAPEAWFGAGFDATSLARLPRGQRRSHRGADIGHRKRFRYHVVYDGVEAVGALALIGKTGHQQNRQVRKIARFGAVFGGDDIVTVHGNGARHQRAHRIFVIGDQHARHRAISSFASGAARPDHTLPPAISRRLKKRASILRPSGGGEASRDLNQARSPGFSTGCSSTAFQA